MRAQVDGVRRHLDGERSGRERDLPENSEEPGATKQTDTFIISGSISCYEFGIFELVTVSQTSTVTAARTCGRDGTRSDPVYESVVLEPNGSNRFECLSRVILPVGAEIEVILLALRYGERFQAIGPQNYHHVGETGR